MTSRFSKSDREYGAIVTGTPEFSRTKLLQLFGKPNRMVIVRVITHDSNAARITRGTKIDLGDHVGFILDKDVHITAQTNIIVPGWVVGKGGWVGGKTLTLDQLGLPGVEVLLTDDDPHPEESTA